MVGSLVLQARTLRGAAAIAALVACLLGAVASVADAAPAKQGRVVSVRAGAAFESHDRVRKPEAAASAPACSHADLAPDGSNLDAIAEATLCLVNAQRAQRDRRALAANAKLARAAVRHVDDMVEHTYFAHEGRDRSTFGDRIRATGYVGARRDWMLGENLAWGTGSLATPREIVRAWMASPGHRANILEASYREIGIGIAGGNPVRPDGAGATYATTFGFVDRPVIRQARARDRAAKSAERVR
jgi:uncharacterized protein YkwD